MDCILVLQNFGPPIGMLTSNMTCQVGVSFVFLLDPLRSALAFPFVIPCVLEIKQAGIFSRSGFVLLAHLPVCVQMFTQLNTQMK